MGVKYQVFVTITQPDKSANIMFNDSLAKIES